MQQYVVYWLGARAVAMVDICRTSKNGSQNTDIVLPVVAIIANTEGQGRTANAIKELTERSQLPGAMFFHEKLDEVF